jgi:hypothetical protein
MEETKVHENCGFEPLVDVQVNWLLGVFFFLSFFVRT